MYKTFLLPLLSLLFIGCNAPAVSPYPAPQWTQCAPFPDGPRSSAAVAVAGGQAYLFFGKRAARTAYQRDCWAYDPQADTWTKRTPCPGTARVKAVAATVDNRIYTGLGYDNGGLFSDEAYLDDFWSYDPQTDRWEREADAPFKGTDACVAFARDGQVYVGMGFHGTTFGREWWTYSPTDSAWTRLDDFHYEDRAGALLCADSAHTYMGTGYRTYCLNDWWEYAPETDSWTRRRKMPDSGRVNGTALVVSGRYFVTTGRLFHGELTGGHVKAGIIEYDPAHDVWYDHGTLPGTARENAVAFTIGHRGYIGLGENDKGLLEDIYRIEANH